MRKTIRKIISRIFRPVFIAIRKIFGQIRFWQEYRRFKILQDNDSRFQLSWKERYPILNEKTATTQFDSHYTYHPAWAARILAQTRPVYHVDISSTLNFCAIVSAFIPVSFYDYRPARLNLDNLSSQHADLLALPFEDESILSLSCMHVIEHVGLGRYGDPLDPDGDLKAIAELMRVLKKDGSLLFVTPVGKPKTYFNAHRVYSYEQIAEYFSGLATVEFALIDDNGCFSIGADPVYANVQEYGCGCWWFRK